MRRDDRDDPFRDIFDEIERMMGDFSGGFDDSGFATETHVDVFDEGDVLRLVADLPGVEKGDVSLQCDGEVLTIEAVSEQRHYQERVTLPARVDEHAAQATFNNGVLEVTLEKVTDSTDIDLE